MPALRPRAAGLLQRSPRDLELEPWIYACSRPERGSPGSADPCLLGNRFRSDDLVGVGVLEAVKFGDETLRRGQREVQPVREDCVDVDAEAVGLQMDGRSARRLRSRPRDSTEEDLGTKHVALALCERFNSAIVGRLRLSLSLGLEGFD